MKKGVGYMLLRSLGAIFYSRTCSNGTYTVRRQNSVRQNSVLLTIFGKNMKNRQKRVVVSLIDGHTS